MFIDQLPVAMYFRFMVREHMVPAVFGEYGYCSLCLTHDMNRIGELNNRTIH
jgi:hypothetical protein